MSFGIFPAVNLHISFCLRFDNWKFIKSVTIFIRHDNVCKLLKKMKKSIKLYPYTIFFQIVYIHFVSKRCDNCISWKIFFFAAGIFDIFFRPASTKPSGKPPILPWFKRCWRESKLTPDKESNDNGIAPYVPTSMKLKCKRTFLVARLTAFFHGFIEIILKKTEETMLEKD